MIVCRWERQKCHLTAEYHVKLHRETINAIVCAMIIWPAVDLFSNIYCGHSFVKVNNSVFRFHF